MSHNGFCTGIPEFQSPNVIILSLNLSVRESQNSALWEWILFNMPYYHQLPVLNVEAVGVKSEVHISEFDKCEHGGNCLSIDVEGLCHSAQSDFNYYALCRAMLSTYSNIEEGMMQPV